MANRVTESIVGPAAAEGSIALAGSSAIANDSRPWMSPKVAYAPGEAWLEGAAEARRTIGNDGRSANEGGRHE